MKNYSSFREIFAGNPDVVAIDRDYGPKKHFEPYCTYRDTRKCHDKCGKCKDNSYHTYDNKILKRHMKGEDRFGIYPLISGKIAKLLVADFDKKNKKQDKCKKPFKDAKLYAKIAAKLGLSAYIERSKSGNGYHVWIFFSKEVSVDLVDKLHETIMGKLGAKSLASFDKIFPQKPKNPVKFGLLIALPYWGDAQKGCTVMLNEKDGYKPYKDVSHFLKEVKTNTPKTIKNIIKNHFIQREPKKERTSARTSRVKFSKASLENILISGVQEGERNYSATRVAGHFFSLGLNSSKVKKKIFAWNKKNNPPLDESELMAVIRSVSRYHATNGNNKAIGSIESTARQIRYKLDQKDSRSEGQRIQQTLKMIFGYFKDNGELLKENGKPFYFYRPERLLIEIDKEGEALTELLYRLFHFIVTDKIYPHLVAKISAEALAYGKEITVKRHCYLDKHHYILYLFNNKEIVYEISSKGIIRRRNGYNGIYFKDDPNFEPFEYLGHRDKPGTLNKYLLANMNLAKDKVLSPAEYRLIVRYYICALYFRELFRTKPILVFRGEKGSGKTFISRSIGKIFYGNNFEVTMVPDDLRQLIPALTSSAFLALDNLDNGGRKLDDLLATIATGISQKLRKLYTTNTMVEYFINCFVAISTRTPKFNRDDVADRAILVELNRLERFIPEEKLLEPFAEYRSEIMSQLITMLQRTLRRLKHNKGKSLSYDFRLADFADFFVRAQPAKQREQALAILEKIQKTQTQFVAEGTDLFDLMAKWVPGHQKHYYSYKDLHKELIQIAKLEEIPFPYQDNQRGFSQKMATLRSNLESIYHIEEKSIRHGQKAFRFRLKEKV